MSAQERDLGQWLPTKAVVVHLESDAGKDLARCVADRVDLCGRRLTGLNLADLIRQDFLKLRQGH